MSAPAIRSSSDSDEVLRAANEVIDGLHAERLSLVEDLRVAREQLAAFDGIQYVSHHLSKEWKDGKTPVTWVLDVEYRQRLTFQTWIEVQVLIRQLRDKARQLRPHADGRHIT